MRLQDYAKRTIYLDVCEATLPEEIYNIMYDSAFIRSDAIQFEAYVDDYPIVVYGKHVVHVSFRLYGLEWEDDGTYGCTLTLDKSSINVEQVALSEFIHGERSQVLNKIITISEQDDLCKKCYDLLWEQMTTDEQRQRS